VWTASDEALVAGLCTEDSEVARVFVRRFQTRVFGLAMSITRDRQAAEEVAQDAFVRAWRYAASFDPRRGSAAAWLLSITRNAAIDYVRMRERRIDQPDLDPIEDMVELPGDAGVPSPHENLAEIAAAVRSLPVEQREVLFAAAYCGFTTREISEAWDIPLGTVKTRLRLAMQKLRDAVPEVAP
jgi:RNA polymerase sigma factor (sigma-70 family)